MDHESRHARWTRSAIGLRAWLKRRRCRQLGLVVLCLAALVAAGCGGSSSKSRPAPAEAVREQLLNLSVVGIQARIGGDEVRSSGTVIAVRRGLVVTSAHSVWGATSLRVMTGLGVLHGRVVARAPCDDLALLEMQPRVPGLASLPAGAGRGSVSAGLLTAVGRRAWHADDGSSSLSEIPVRVSGRRARLLPGLGLRALGGAVRLDSDLVGEATGGPVIDRRARPVGMAVVAGFSGRRTAVVVPWDAVNARLRQLRPGPRRLYVGWRSQYRCAQRLNAFARAGHPRFRALDARLYAPPSISRLPGTEGVDR